MICLIHLCENEYFLITNLHGSFTNAQNVQITIGCSETEP